MPIPSYQDMMLPLLQEAAARGLTRIPEVATAIADHFGLTEEERTQLRPGGGQTVLQNRLHWAKLYLSHAGLLDRPAHGRFVITPQGRELLAQNPPHIDNAVLRRYPSFAAFLDGEPDGEAPQPDGAGQLAPEAATPEEQIDAACQAMRATLRSTLLSRIRANSSEFFEDLIVKLLVAMGYGGTHQNAAQRLGRTGDGGIDGVINEDRLGLDRVYIQAKRWTNTVGAPEINSFLGALVRHGASKGVFVTTSSFSATAVEVARQPTHRIVLIDGKMLADLMIEHGVGVRVSRSVEFKRIDEDFFSEED